MQQGNQCASHTVLHCSSKLVPTNNLPSNSTILAPHLSLTKRPSFFLQSRDDSGPCKGKGTVHIFLYFIVGVTHLGNQHIQQNHKHSNQEGHVHDNREPAGDEGEGGSHKCPHKTS